VRANYLASPPLVVAYAIAGDMNVDVAADPIGISKDGSPVFLKDIWPSQKEIAEIVERTVTRESFRAKYADVFKGDELWQKVPVDRARPTTGRRPRPTCRTRPISRACPRTLARSQTSRAPASSRSSPTR
jgi:aconitase A